MTKLWDINNETEMYNKSEVDWIISTLPTWWDMLKSENLSWLSNYATARTNLWLNTTANQTDSTDKRFMTDAQESKLDAITWTNTWDNAVNSLYSWLATSKQDTLVSWTNIKTINWTSILWSWDIVVVTTKQHRITIPGEQIADTSNYQWLYFYNDTGATITISNVAFAVWKAAAWSWAACACNIYKSSWTAADWLNTNAVNLFTTAVDLWTWYTSLTNVPNTATVENGRWVTLRVTSSAGSTNRSSDLQCIITYS